MSRLFISHSSRDNIQALAFQNWLTANGWAREDVFVDLHGIGAGERWRDTLRKANASCEAVVLLASPEALGSVECQKELELAEALGKEVILAILRDLTKDDARLARFSDRQFVDLSAEPLDRMEPFEFEGRVHRVEFSSQALAAIKARLGDLGIAPGSFAWPPKGVTEPEPYPGLAAFGEDDAGIFFGREADIMSALTEIRMVRRRRTPRLIVIDAASGAGKSSFLRAGLWPRLSRDPDFAPLAILRPAQGILTGPDGVGRRMAPFFQRYGKVKAPGAIHAALATADAAAGAAALAALLTEATGLAATARRAASPDAKAPAALIAIDQGEELFSAENDTESRMFLAQLAAVLKAPPDGVDPYVLITIRADSVQSLLTRVAELGLETPKALYLPPLSQAAYRDVILKPAEIYSERVRRLTIEPALANALVEDAAGADALPLLAFTLFQLFANYALEGQITLARYREMGGASGSIRRALDEALARVGAAGTAANLRRLIVPRLATWDPDADQRQGSAKRVVADIQSVIGGDRAALVPLANALIAARLLTRSKDTLEVAHEALLRQPPISDWLEENRGFLVWRDRLARERQSFENNQRGMLAGRELQIAREWLRVREADDIAAADHKFIADSAAEDDKRRTVEEAQERRRQEAELEAAKAREAAAQERVAASKRVLRRTIAGLVGALAFAVLAGAAGVFAFAQLKEAEKSALRAEVAEKEALSQRDVALQSRSRFLTGLAQDQSQRGNTTNATLLALEAIPEGQAGQDAAYTLEARALVKAGTNVESAVAAGSTRGSGSIRSVDIHPEMTRAVALMGREALMLDVRTGAVLGKLANARETILDARFSRDGRRVLTVTDDLVEEWDGETGQRLRILCAHGTALQAVAFSSGGLFLLTVGKDGMAQVWNTATGKLAGPPINFDSIFAYQARERSSFSFMSDRRLDNARFAVTDNGRRVLTKGSSDSVALWDVETGRIMAVSEDKNSLRTSEKPPPPLEGQGKPTIGSLGKTSGYALPALSPDGRLFAMGNGENQIAIFNTETGALERTTAEAHASDVVLVVFNRAGTRLLSGGHDNTAYLWDVANGERLATLEGHDFWVTEGEFSPDGAFALTRASSKSIVWDLRGPMPVRLPGTGEDAQSLGRDNHQFSPDSRSLVSFGDRNNRLVFKPLDAGANSPAAQAEPTRNEMDEIEQASRLVAVDAQSGRVLLAARGGNNSILDVDTNKPVAKLGAPPSSIDAALLSIEQRVLVTSSMNGDGVWQWDLDKMVRTIGNPIAYGSDATLQRSPDKRHFSVLMADSSIVVQKIGDAEGQRVRTFADKLLSLSGRSRDGRRLMLYSRIDAKAFILDIGGNAPPIEIKNMPASFGSASFSPDGTLLAMIGNSGLMVWDTASGALLAASERSKNAITSFSFSPDGRRIAALSNDNVARVWTHATGLTIELQGNELKDQAKALTSVEFSPDGRRIATASQSGEARVWDAQNGAIIAVLKGHEADSSINSAAFSPDNRRVVTTASDKTARVWNAETGKEILVLTGHKDWVRDARFSPDGKTIVTGADDNARLWNAETGIETVVLKGHSGWVTRVRFGADGQRFLTSSNGDTRVWDAKTAQLIRAFDGSEFPDIDFSSFVSVSVDTSVGIAAFGSDALVARLRGHKNSIADVNFSPDGSRVVSASSDGTAKVWEVASGRLLATTAASDQALDHAIFLGGSARIATASRDFRVRLWDATDGHEIAASKPFEKIIGSLQASPDGERVLIASYDGTARIWNPATGADIEFRGHTEDVNSAMFSPDGRRVATVSDDATVRIWDAATGAEKQRLLGNGSAGLKVAWRPDGRRLIVTSRSGLLTLELLAEDREFATIAPAMGLPRCLTQEQRARFYLTPEPPQWCVDGGKWPYDTPEWRARLAPKPAANKP